MEMNMYKTNSHILIDDEVEYNFLSRGNDRVLIIEQGIDVGQQFIRIHSLESARQVWISLVASGFLLKKISNASTSTNAEIDYNYFLQLAADKPHFVADEGLEFK